ncbi:polysaccharide deacetylase family protein [Aquirufa aurantiipilula]|uniref:polysaccharide deacetylase family protein n=1 Tax=Aquirufa aurantiipilula TaxID=2696561 RepID=UPI001CAA4C03|nr:polysaccharide deacetylase family protein [Aquirufa aurantiipilula]MBZ1325479.1 polysaccharide deacetylase family protein [Aquirufa aurantiipilula]
MFIHRLPSFVPSIFPSLIWDKKADAKENQVYFTFDDGPSPEITNFVLDELDKFQAKATFFCIGKNMRQYPEIAQSIHVAGHSLGNHTMNHVNAWKVSHEDYIANKMACDLVFSELNIPSIGFRPPYGRVNRALIKKSSEIGPIYMWSLLTGDYNSDLSHSSIIDHCLKNIHAGSIVVFHDSQKAFPHLKVILPQFLAYCHDKGFQLSAL